MSYPYGQQPYNPGQPGQPPYNPGQQPYPGQSGQPPYNPQQSYNPQQPGQQPYNAYNGQAQPNPYGSYPQSPPMNQYGGAPNMNSGYAPMYSFPATHRHHNSWYSAYYSSIQPNQMMELQAWFAAYDRDRSGTITAYELAGLNFGGVPLGMETAKKLIRVFDKNRTGAIDFYEYAATHQFLKQMQTGFSVADRDRNMQLDASEIHAAIVAGGFTDVAFPVVQGFFRKYDVNNAGVIRFEQYLDMCASIALVKSKFSWADQTRSGYVTLNFNQLLEMICDI